MAHVTKDSVTQDFTYDPNGNRTSGYDANGNPISNINYDSQDRLMTWGAYSYTYDRKGTLTSRHNSTTGETMSYHYDLFGNLTEVDFSTGKTITYKVDAYGRRVARTVDPDGPNGSQQPKTTTYLYNAASQLVAMHDPWNNVWHFIYGTRQNTPDLIYLDDFIYRVLSDHLGSPRLVVDTTDLSDTLLEARYDAWGNASGFFYNFPFGFAGGLYDPDTGLVRFGARDYDPMTGRWTSKDPILFGGGQENLYVYAEDDPVNHADPSGRVGFAIGGGGAVDSSVAMFLTAVTGWPGVGGVGLGSGFFVDVSASRGLSLGVYDSGSARLGVSMPAQVAGGAAATFFTDLSKFSGSSVVGKGEVGKIGVGVGSGLLSISFGPGTGAFLGLEISNTELLGLRFKPWGSGPGCSLVL